MKSFFQRGRLKLLINQTKDRYTMETMQLCIHYCAFVNAKFIGDMVIFCTDAKSVKDNGICIIQGLGNLTLPYVES